MFCGDNEYVLEMPPKKIKFISMSSINFIFIHLVIHVNSIGFYEPMSIEKIPRQVPGDFDIRVWVLRHYVAQDDASLVSRL